VRGMSLSTGDRVVGMEVLQHGQTLFTVTENGYGKRTSIDEYPIHRRGGKGVITIKTSERNGQVVNIILVQDDDDLMLVTNNGKLIRMPVSGTSVISRNTQGVRLIVMDSGERVVSAAGLAESEDEDGDSADGEETAGAAGGIDKMKTSGSRNHAHRRCRCRQLGDRSGQPAGGQGFCR
jgi:DNA gyrase subunit A